MRFIVLLIWTNLMQYGIFFFCSLLMYNVNVNVNDDDDDDDVEDDAIDSIW